MDLARALASFLGLVGEGLFPAQAEHVYAAVSALYHGHELSGGYAPSSLFSRIAFIVSRSSFGSRANTLLHDWSGTSISTA